MDDPTVDAVNVYEPLEDLCACISVLTHAPYVHSLLDTQINFFFMDSETFEEINCSDKVVGDREVWLTEGSEVTLVYFNDKVIEVIVPSPAVYEVTMTEPNVKGNTAQGHTKPATLSCGATISVPGFVEQGSMIKVDVDKGEYMERMK
jgi:elongation factor P